jgi:predicted acetyltransferase
VGDVTPGLREWRLTDMEAAFELEDVRVAIARRGGEPTGYAVFRRAINRHALWSEPGRVCEVHEAVALDPPTTRALWGALTNFDLVERTLTHFWDMALDHPLLALLEDPRDAKPRLGDGEWVRVLDLPGAFGRRRYAAPVNLVLDVADALIPANAGRWHLVGGPDGATVERADGAEAELAIGIRELGGLLLGGLGVARLLDAGLVTEYRPGAARELDAAIKGFRQPGNSRGF